MNHAQNYVRLTLATKYALISIRPPKLLKSIKYNEGIKSPLKHNSWILCMQSCHQVISGIEVRNSVMKKNLNRALVPKSGILRPWRLDKVGLSKVCDRLVLMSRGSSVDFREFYRKNRPAFLYSLHFIPFTSFPSLLFDRRRNTTSGKLRTRKGENVRMNLVVKSIWNIRGCRRETCE